MTTAVVRVPWVLHTVRPWTPAVVAAAAVAVTGADQGGYFPVTWGWAALGLLVVLLAALVFGAQVRASAHELAFVTGLAALLAWTAASTTWSESLPSTVLEVERTTVYLAAAAVAVAVAAASHRSSAALVLGVLAACVALSAYALAGRLLHGNVAGAQLSSPLGYWNALALVAAIGFVLSVAVAAQEEQRWIRAAAAASGPVLATTLYLTLSRGGWIALAAGTATLVASDPRRGRLVQVGLTLALPAAVAVATATQLEALVDGGATETSARAGRLLAAELVLLCALSAFLCWRGEPKDAARLSPRTRRAAAVALAALLLGGAAAIAAAGGVQASVTRAYDAFRAPLPQRDASQRRLLQLSGHGRADYWRVAWDQYESAPLLGTGAGTYALHWASDRPARVDATDAHNLYLETLAELGPVGLGVLLATLAMPLAVLPRARRSPLVPAAAGGYVAYCVHAALDWDWELPAVTLAALFLAVAMLVAGRSAHARALGAAGRAAALAGIAVLVAFVFVTLTGNRAVEGARSALTEGRAQRAVDEAGTATRWLPWSAEPLLVRGQAELALGRAHAAREQFVRAAGKDPANWEIWLDRALVSRGRERRAAARRARLLNPLAPELREVGNVNPRSGLASDPNG